MDMTDISGDKVFCFGEYRLCTRARELVHTDSFGDAVNHDAQCCGESIMMEPKVLDLLIYLLENRERIVSKPELHKAIWDERPVSETVLSHCVMKARQAVGDNGRRQHYIRTVRGRGYRFIAEATIEPPQSHSIEQPVSERSSWVPRVDKQWIKHAFRRPGLLYAVAAVGLFFWLGVMTSQVAHSCFI